MDQGRFDRLTAALGTGSGRRTVAGLLIGTAAVLGQGSGASSKRRKKCKQQECKQQECTHCPQRACCSCTADNSQTASKCILLETPNADITLTAAVALCDAFCNGPNERVFGVNDNIAGFANVCRANNACDVEECPIKL